MVLALIVTLPHSLPMQTNPIQKGMRMWSNTNHRCTHAESWAANATCMDWRFHKLEPAHTLSSCGLLDICVFIRWWNDLFAASCKKKKSCLVGMQVLQMTARLRAVEKPIWPHFYFDGSADWFATAWRQVSHTCTRTHMYSRCSHFMCSATVFAHVYKKALVSRHLHVYMDTYPQLGRQNCF